MLKSPFLVILDSGRNALVVILLFFLSTALAQKPLSKNAQTYLEPTTSAKHSALACVAPTGMTYSANNAFYCTGIPIAPNVLSYSGSPYTSLTISPDLPTGLSFNMADGTISGTPTEDVSGNYTVILVNPCGSAHQVIYMSVSSGTSYYADTDGDGYGSGPATISCTGQPAGTSTNNTDCAPADPTKWKSANLFIDQDLDGYNNGFAASPRCYGAAVPTGYTAVNIGTDCNDTNKNVNPNAVEVLGNGIDDNCDGVIDESAATSNLIPSSCGVTITDLSTTLFAQPISGAQGYRFEVTNGGNVGVYETAFSRFNLRNITPGVTYSTTSTVNSVRVAVKINGYWRPYGTPCIVTTQLVPNSTSVSSPACGSFLSDIWNTIFCYNIPSATGYRFRVRLGSTLIGTYDTTVNRFTLPNVGINNLVFATAYTIDVLLQINGVWRPDTEYGNTCVIVTPPTPSPSRVTVPSCGSSTNSVWTTVFAVPVTGAQGYKFVVNNGIQYREIVTSGTSFSIHSIPGGPVPGTTYMIRVDVLYNNSYVEGLQWCTLNVLPTASRETRRPVEVFEVKSYPNPFTDTFKLQLNTSSEEDIGLKVYDMLGREVEAKILSLSQAANYEIGAAYPGGVYHVIVSQGEGLKSLRIIKR